MRGHREDNRRRVREAAEALFKPKPASAPEPPKKVVILGKLPNGTEYPYVYHWRREGRKDQLCRVLKRGSMNSCLVEFQDGFQMVTSRNAIRKPKKGQ